MPELAQGCPEGLRYTTYQSADKVSFAGLPTLPRHRSTFQRYRAALDDICVEPPTVAHVETVGAYRTR